MSGRRIPLLAGRMIRVVLMACLLIPSAQVAPAATRQDFLWPVKGGTMNSAYGMRLHPIKKVYKLHSGIDIISGNGVVLATKSGSVVEVVRDRCNECVPIPKKDGTARGCSATGHSYGNYVIVKHDDDGKYSFYAHLKYGSATRATRVNQGDPIGTVGSTGQSQGNHLHFEIRKTKTGGFENPNPRNTTYPAGLPYVYNKSHPAHVYHANMTTAGHPHIATCGVDGVTQGAAQYSGQCTKCLPPGAPSSIALSATDVAVGGSLTASWSGVSGAVRYRAVLERTSGTPVTMNLEVTNPSAVFMPKEPGTYRVSVRSVNQAGKASDAPALSKSVVVHEDVIARFLDHDGVVLSEQQLRYGGTAKAPIAPSREGYAFQGWDRDLSNITTDSVIAPRYLVNTYTVKFIGEGGRILSTQKVVHGEDAVPPSETMPPPGHVFVDWASQDFVDVQRSVSVDAVYALANPDLPIQTTIGSAARDASAQGYTVSVDLLNYVASTVRGKLVVVLKTAGGKMVDSETETFSLGGNGSATRNVYIPYEGVATRVEVSIVGVATGNNTGAPLSETSTATVDMGDNWSAWSTEVPSSGAQSESRTEHRYRDKKTTTGSSSVMTGWTLTGQTFVWGNWSAWSKAQPVANSDREIITRSVETKHYKTQWHYGRYWYNNNYNTAANPPATGSYWFESSPWKDYAFTLVQTFSGGSQKFKDQVTGQIWYRAARADYGDYTRTVYSHSTYHTEWQYRDKIYTYAFEQWGDWSPWSTTAVTGSATREVESRTTYRFKNDSVFKTAYNYKRYKYQNMTDGVHYYTYSSAWPDSQGWPGAWEYSKRYSEYPVAQTTPEGVRVYNLNDDPWFSAQVNSQGASTVYVTQDSLEDTLGEPRTILGRLDAPGRKATLMVFKGANVDPTASQLEYVSQTTLGANGEYEFTFVPREEPSLTTGDFSVVIGVEGAGNPVSVGTIDAPRPTYEVQFVDADGTVLDRQTVTEGGSATPPASPSADGMTFVGWSVGTTNIRDDLTVVARYVKKQHVVVFVNWHKNWFDLKIREHGAPLDSPSVEMPEGSEFEGWTDQNGALVQAITGDVVLSAKFKPKKFKVTFLDEAGATLAEQFVEYGEAAAYPEGYGPDASSDLVDESAGLVSVSSLLPDGTVSEETTGFAGWTDEDQLECVTKDLVLAPIIMQKETAPRPVATVPGGLYSGPQTVTLSCDHPDATIVYTLDGTEPSYEGAGFEADQVGMIYVGTPIEISADTMLKVAAYAEGMNLSDTCVEQYLIRPAVEVSVRAADAAHGTVTGGGSYPETAETSVTAVPRTGYRFVRWTEGSQEVTTAATYLFTVDAARDLVAEFEALPVVAVAVENGRGGSVSGGGPVEAGQTKEVIATPATGYRFDCWLRDGAPVSTQPRYSFVVEGSVNLVARFQALPTAAGEVKSVYADSATILVTSSGTGVVGVGYRLDGEPTVTVSAAAAVVKTSGLGTHSLKTWAVDGAGNLGSASVRTFTVKRSTRVVLGTKSTSGIAYASPVVIRGSLAAGSGAVDGLRVALESSSDGVKFTESGGGIVRADGSIAISVAPTSKTWYRLVFKGDVTSLASAATPAIIITPKAAVGAPVAPRVMYVNRSKTVYGSLAGRHVAGSYPVRIYKYRYTGGRWKSYGYVSAKASDFGGVTRYSAKVKLPYRGKWRLRAYHADAGHAASWSRYDYVTVR